MEIEILNFFNVYNNYLVDFVMSLLTHAGDKGLIWLFISLGLFINKKTRMLGFTCLLTLVIMQIIGNMTLKPIIRRPRPFVEYAHFILRIKAPHGFSFPSGHSYSSFAVAFVILFSQQLKIRVKNIWKILALILAVLIAFSRVYFTVHYPTDIIAGMILGIGTAYLVVNLISLPLLKKSNSKILKLLKID